MNNLIIRNALIKYNVRTWQLARDILKISEPTIYRKLRSELPEDEQKQIASQIANFAMKGGFEHGKAADNR